MLLVPLSVQKVTQFIPGGQQEGEHGVVHQVQGEHYQRNFISVFLIVIGPVGNPESVSHPQYIEEVQISSK